MPSNGRPGSCSKQIRVWLGEAEAREWLAGAPNGCCRLPGMKCVEPKESVRSSNPELRARWRQIFDEGERAEAAWIEELRRAGIKAAHPDDGWVNRSQNSVEFVYPQFDDGVEPGDLICLGQPSQDMGKQRIVVVTSIADHGILEPGPVYFFEDGMPNKPDVIEVVSSIEPLNLTATFACPLWELHAKTTDGSWHIVDRVQAPGDATKVVFEVPPGDWCAFKIVSAEMAASDAAISIGSADK